jgi:hypothetical protein
VAAVFIADGQASTHSTQRYGYGLIGTASGVTLGGVALSLGEVHNSGALLTHSGAMVGATYGALTEFFIEGKTTFTPATGLGIGAAGGVLVAGTVAAQLPEFPSSTVLYLDLGVVLGGLAGAGIARPVVVGEPVTPSQNRIWITSALLGAAIGGITTYALLPDEAAPTSLLVKPYVAQLTFGQNFAPRPWVFGFGAHW